MAEFRAPTPLILLAQAGDRHALEELFRGIQQPLYDYLLRLVSDPHLAEDVLQEVFVLLWRKLSWLRDPDLFRPWAYRIASREGFRRLRQQPGLVLLGRADLDEVVETVPADPLPAWVDCLSDYLSVLSPASRAVLVLHYQHGLTLDEVAGALELSSGTVKSRLAYGLARLRQKLKPGETS